MMQTTAITAIGIPTATPVNTNDIGVELIRFVNSVIFNLKY